MGNRPRQSPRREIPPATPNSRYIADFACMEAKLIIEIDGNSHDIADQIEHDAERTRILNTLDWRVLRLRDRLVLADASAASALIVEALRRPSP